MEFHYYYLIQDIIGLITAFVGIRMLMLCFRFVFYNKISKVTYIFISKYMLITLAGSNLLFNQFGLKPWIISIILIFLSTVITPKKKFI
ncbi:hypothetical protein EAI30_07295 [Romboutsia ilealis]|uniref:Uncharacterized protein n=1 Tax=Romboutsia faecis TaxID=2764597 RepID=A0ABR7JK82_9FIRM|nr:hypothetical protein [Romboutsia faecis]MBC5995336.1 hypothetical protein [Romboutsia faecis]MRN24418.1 hypothetical protein [Romboutsia ilealis]